MGVARDFTLLTIDPDTGKSLVGISETDAVFGGAVLVDLALSGRIEVTGSAAKARVARTNAAPPADAVLDHAAGRIKPGSNRKASDLVTRLGKGARAGLLDQLVDEGVLRARRHKVLGLFPVTLHDVIDRVRRDELVHAVDRVLAGASEPDDTTGPLIALLTAANLLKRFVPRGPERKATLKRAKSIAAGDWAGTASKAAIDAASAAMTAVLTATAITATGSASN